MKLLYSLVLIFIINLPLNGQVNQLPPLLTFTQTETISIQPNVAVVCFELRKEFTQVRNNRLIDIFTELEISSKLFGVDGRNIKLFPTIQDSIGFVKKGIITLNNLDKLDALHLSLKQRDVVVIYTHLTHSNLNYYKQRAYLSGIKNAKIQALELSKILNAGLGKLYSINESRFQIINNTKYNILPNNYIFNPAEINLVLELQVSYLLN